MNYLKVNELFESCSNALLSSFVLVIATRDLLLCNILKHHLFSCDLISTLPELALLQFLRAFISLKKRQISILHASKLHMVDPPEKALLVFK